MLDGTSERSQAWEQVAQGRDDTFAAIGEAVAQRLRASLQTVSAQARAEREQREETWRPMRVAISEWASLSRRATRDYRLLATIKAAETWLAAALVGHERRLAVGWRTQRPGGRSP